jgi:hypothetical protein
VLDVGGFGPPKRVLQVWHGRECRFRGVDPSWSPCGYFLDEPGIAIRIIEGEEGPVAGALGVGAGLPRLDGERRAVPHVTDIEAKVGQPVMGGLDIGDDEPPLGRARRGRREPLAECDRGPRPRGCELDDAKPVERGYVIIEPPTQSLVERLGPSTSDTGMIWTSRFILTLRTPVSVVALCISVTPMASSSFLSSLV